ncbi:MAG TPA: sigma-70 family RNA polymerase sigma factor [bacterium]|nr:sigma-70 family RNA polymerase sigma factor [bacterium]
MAEVLSVLGGPEGMTSPFGDRGAVRGGDEPSSVHRLAAFEELVQRHQGQIYRVAYRLTGNHDDAEDLAQEAIVEAFRAFDRYQPGTYFDRWLYRIMSRTYIDTVRRRNRRPMVSLDAPIGGAGGPLVMLMGDSRDDPQQRTEATDLEGTIQAALDRLPEEFRTAIVLADIEGLSYDEVAHALRCPVGTVRSRLHRARQTLRDTIGSHVSARRGDR